MPEITTPIPGKAEITIGPGGKKDIVLNVTGLNDPLKEDDSVSLTLVYRGVILGYWK